MVTYIHALRIFIRRFFPRVKNVEFTELTKDNVKLEISHLISGNTLIKVTYAKISYFAIFALTIYSTIGFNLQIFQLNTWFYCFFYALCLKKANCLRACDFQLNMAMLNNQDTASKLCGYVWYIWLLAKNNLKTQVWLIIMIKRCSKFMFANC